MTASLAIAHNTFHEALRERLLYNLAIFAAVLIAGSLTISQLTLGEQYRIIADVAASATQIFGTVISVFLGVALVARELDRRTCYAVLARPVARGSFVLGKFLGLLATVTLNLAVMAAVSMLVLRVYQGSWRHLGGAFAAAFGMMALQFAVCIGFAVLFAVLTTPTLATIFTLTLVAAGWGFSEVRSFWLRAGEVRMKPLVHVLDVVLPNMGLLDYKEALLYGDPVSLGSLAARAAYGAGYAAVLVGLAALAFSRKDVR